MTEGYFSEQVTYNLIELQLLFNLSDEELLLGISYAEKIGWLAAKPSTIALTIIRIIKKDYPNQLIYKLGKTEYQTMKKWTTKVCKILGINQIWFSVS